MPGKGKRFALLFSAPVLKQTRIHFWIGMDVSATFKTALCERRTGKPQHSVQRRRI